MGNIVNSNDLKCQSCHYMASEKPLSNCETCKYLNIPGKVICDLNIEGQDLRYFSCSAYKHAIKLYSAKSEKAQDPDPVTNDYTLSEDQTYRIKLNIQKSQNCPEAIFSTLNFHFIVICKALKNFFQGVDHLAISSLFASKRLYESQVVIIPLKIHDNHIHFYVEGGVDQSCEDIFAIIKEKLNKFLFQLHRKEEIISESYFTQTMG